MNKKLGLKTVLVFIMTVLMFISSFGMGATIYAQGTDFFGDPEPPPPPPKQEAVRIKPKVEPQRPIKKKVLPPKRQKKISNSDIIFLLDVSGSMEAASNHPRVTKLKAAQNALTYFSKKMHEGTRFQLWTFSTGLKRTPNSSNVSTRGALPIFEYIGNKNSVVRNHFVRNIQSIKTGDETHLYMAIAEAIKYFQTPSYFKYLPQEARKKIIVVLADGQDDNRNSIKLPHVLALKNQFPEVEIKTIGFGIQPDGKLKNILCLIATNENCTISNDSKSLKKILRQFTGS